jgi:hypothetical protein
MNKRIEELAKELLSEIENESKKKPQEIARGNIVEIAGDEWIILKVDGDKVCCLHKEILDERIFDSNTNNWTDSSIKKFLNSEFYNRVSSEVGSDNILPINTNLISLDGQKEYGESNDYVSLLTVDLYRENRDIIPNTGEWWWLATPWSTKNNGYERTTCVVSPRGLIDYVNCYRIIGVRPFCIFYSSIFKS